MKPLEATNKAMAVLAQKTEKDPFFLGSYFRFYREIAKKNKEQLLNLLRVNEDQYNFLACCRAPKIHEDMEKYLEFIMSSVGMLNKPVLKHLIAMETDKVK